MRVIAKYIIIFMLHFFHGNLYIPCLWMEERFHHFRKKHCSAPIHVRMNDECNERTEVFTLDNFYFFPSCSLLKFNSANNYGYVCIRVHARLAEAWRISLSAMDSWSSIYVCAVFIMLINVIKAASTPGSCMWINGNLMSEGKNGDHFGGRD